MKFMTLAALAAALPLHGADALSDLRQTLDRFPAAGTFAATAKVQINAVTQADAGRAGQAGFDIESGHEGFTIHVTAKTLQAASREAAAKKQDADAATPTRTAMVALTIFDVMDAIDAGALLRDALSGATLLDQKPATIDGKPATVIRVKVKPSLATRSRFVGEPQIELKVWIGADGTPIAAERVSKFTAGVAFVKGENTRSERWEFATAGDRLYATRNDEDDEAAAAGKHLKSSRTVWYTRK